MVTKDLPATLVICNLPLLASVRKLSAVSAGLIISAASCRVNRRGSSLMSRLRLEG